MTDTAADTAAASLAAGTAPASPVEPDVPAGAGVGAVSAYYRCRIHSHNWYSYTAVSASAVCRYRHSVDYCYNP